MPGDARIVEKAQSRFVANGNVFAVFQVYLRTRDEELRELSESLLRCLPQQAHQFLEKKISTFEFSGASLLAQSLESYAPEDQRLLTEIINQQLLTDIAKLLSEKFVKPSSAPI